MSTLNQRNERALGFDYPAGAEQDPDAPWNEKDEEPCGKCEGTGEVNCPTCRGLRRDGSCPECEYGKHQCDKCEGTGYWKSEL